MAKQKPSTKAALTTRASQRRGVPEQEQFEVTTQQKRSNEPITAKNDAQKRYINAINTFTLTFATGSAGVGKTYLCGAVAAELLENKTYEKIVITRPAVEAGENLGFLPGDLDEKFAPYLAPFRDVLNERLGKTFVDYLIKMGRIEAAPLAYMRGRTFKNSFVILDEAQNTTPTQMKMFLTRIGEGSKVVVNGDLTQKDIVGESGLQHAIERVTWIPSVKVVHFTNEDVVRCGLVSEIIKAYSMNP